MERRIGRLCHSMRSASTTVASCGATNATSSWLKGGEAKLEEKQRSRVVRVCAHGERAVRKLRGACLREVRGRSVRAAPRGPKRALRARRLVPCERALRRAIAQYNLQLRIFLDLKARLSGSVLKKR